MKSKGLHDRVDFRSADQILVPSETSEGKCYFVDLITMLCECDWAERGNLCKHVVLAKHICEEMGVDIDECRKGLAHCLSEQGSYEWDGNYLIVHHGQSFGVVNLQTKNCTCLASSLKEICVCLRVSEILVLQDAPEENIQSISNHVKDHVTPCKTVKEMIRELYTWSESTEFCERPELLPAVNRVYQLAFGQYISNTRKRKIQKLHKYRLRVNEAKKTIQHMHSYTLKNGINRAMRSHRPDSQFKITAFKRRVRDGKNRIHFCNTNKAVQK